MRGAAVSKQIGLGLSVLGSLHGSCIIAGDKCDAHQVQLDSSYDVCVCEPGAVWNAGGAGCTPCGEHQEIQSGVCVCSAGFVKAADGVTCIESAIGAPCGPDVACMAAFPYCAIDQGSAGYCTSQDCTANADCPAGWSCEVAAGVRYCHRPPTGLGAPCRNSDECSSFEANYCDVVQTHTCILEGCATDGVACPNEWSCCDYSALFGAPLSTCVAPAMIVSGACPQGGRLVTP